VAVESIFNTHIQRNSRIGNEVTLETKKNLIQRNSLNRISAQFEMKVMVLKSNSLCSKISLNGSLLYRCNVLPITYIVGGGYVRGQIQQDTLDNYALKRHLLYVYRIIIIV